MKEANVDLLEKILKGNAIALIGSGPSSAMGYPSWSELAKKTHAIAQQEGYELDEESFKQHIEKEEYPNAFSCLQNSVSKEDLLKFMKRCLIPSEEECCDEIYKMITRWPFQCYLTTNFDDEISLHLRGNGRKNFRCLLNSVEDFYNIRNDMRDYIFKIHGSLDKNDSAIVTAEDYHALTHGSAWQYYRDNLKCIFKMFNVIIIGHSLSDPDVMDIIDSVKEISSPTNPIYMFLSNVSSSDIRLYRTNNNIQIFKYTASGKDHSQLARLLNVYDSFIFPTQKSLLRQSNDSLNAASLYAFRVLNKAKETIDLENFLLMNIPSRVEHGVGIDGIKRDTNIHNIDINYDYYLAELSKKGFIKLNHGMYNRTAEGDDLVMRCQVSAQSIENFAIDTAIESLAQKVPCVDKNKYKKIIKETIIHIFENRGLIIVQKMFSETITSGEVVDIFEEIAHVASNIDDLETRIAFIQVMRDFILYPTNHQKQFLTSIAQGFFMFQMMGNCSEHATFRKNIFANTYWFVDSNMLIPLLAKGCFNHDFAVDLFSKLKEKNAQLFVTNRILLEVKEHLKWAIDNCQTRSDLFANATLISGNKQNLFIDGFIRLRNTITSISFFSYCSDIERKLAIGLEQFLVDFNITIKNLDLSDKSTAECFEKEKLKIEALRRESFTYRRNLQVATEAELLILMSDLMKEDHLVYFLSQSSIFSKTETKIKTFSGEATYRYLLSLPDSSCSQHLHECLLNELYASGINFIDKDNYNQFFDADIELAKLNYESEKRKYIDLLGVEYNIAELDQAFNATPDLEKPLFVEQMSTKIANLSTEKYLKAQEENNRKSEIIASKDVEIERLHRELERQKEINAKSARTKQVVEATQRNSKNPKHVAKRRKQKNNRRRKK